MLFAAFLLLVLVFGACFHLPFVAFCCSSLLFLVFEIESILSQKPRQTNAFCCSLWLFVARFGFLWMFPFEHRSARCGFLLVRKTKTSNKRQKMSKWKPGFKDQNGQMPLVARFGFLLLVLVFCRCFHLNIALLVLVFCWYERPKRATKGKESPNGNQALVVYLPNTLL